jgi:hypothetical protein
MISILGIGLHENPDRSILWSPDLHGPGTSRKTRDLTLDIERLLIPVFAGAFVLRGLSNTK